MHFTRRDVVAGLSKYNVIIKNVTGARGVGPVDKVMVEEPFVKLPGNHLTLFRVTPHSLPDSHSRHLYSRFVYPIRLSSTALAASLPSRIAHTTSDCPRCISPAVNTPGSEVS